MAVSVTRTHLRKASGIVADPGFGDSHHKSPEERW